MLQARAGLAALEAALQFEVDTEQERANLFHQPAADELRAAADLIDRTLATWSGAD